MAEPIKIDLSQFVQTGAGANGASYDSLSDPNLMLKMYNVGYDTSMIFTESEVARKVYDLGIPSPEPGEIVTDGERIGIRFRRIPGKRSFARAISDEPERIEQYTREFARWCKKLHAIECPEGLFPDAKKDYMKLLDASHHFNAGEKELIRDYIVNKVPAATTALHGDMHFGNVLTTLPKGADFDTPHEVYFIDLGYFSYGYQMFDLGMTYCICRRSSDEFLTKELHFDHVTGAKSWEFFRDEYFYGPEKIGEKLFGPNVNDQVIDDAADIFTLIKLLLVEYNCGGMPPFYNDYTKEVLKKLA